MIAFIGLGALLGSVVCLILLIVAAIRRNPKKKIVCFMLAFFLVFVGAVGMSSDDKQPAGGDRSIQQNEADDSRLSQPEQKEQEPKEEEAGVDEGSVVEDEDEASLNHAPDYDAADSETLENGEPKYLYHGLYYKPEEDETEETAEESEPPMAESPSQRESKPKAESTPQPEPASSVQTTEPQPSPAAPAQSESVESTPVESIPEKQGEKAVSSSGSGRGNADNFFTYDNEAQQQTAAQWVLNTNTMKIHYPSCESVKRIAPENYQTSNASKSDLLAQGYTTCGKCH